MSDEQAAARLLALAAAPADERERVQRTIQEMSLARDALARRPEDRLAL